MNSKYFAPGSVIPGKAGTHKVLNSIASCLRRDGLLKRCLRNISYLSSILFIGLLISCSLPRIIVLDDPLTPEEHLNLGVAYEKNGEFDNSLKEYEIASKKLAVAYLYMGNIYFQKKEFESAESYYKKAIRKDPKNADAYNNLAWLYYVRKENLAEAVNLVLKAIDLNPSKTNIYKDTLDKLKELEKFE